MGNNEYTLQITHHNDRQVYFLVTREGIPYEVSTMGFTSQRGNALFVNTDNNNSINCELYIDGTVQTAGGVNTSAVINYLTNNQDLPPGSTACVKITIKDSNDEVLSTAYDSIVIPYSG